jgi:hypothetical protein
MRPSSMKRGYITSHSDGSKSVTESKPPWGGASTELISIPDFFVLLDFLHGVLSSLGFCHRDFHCRVDEPIA